MFPVLVLAIKELVRMTKCWSVVLMYPVPFSSVVEPELQGAETFGWSWSHNKVLAPAPDRPQEPHTLFLITIVEYENKNSLPNRKIYKIDMISQ
jgi:hypothetical protein